jgi:hypothetical protein
MNKWKPGNLPNSIAEFGIDHQIWTDRDMAKFCGFSFLVGIIIGVAVAWH